MIGAPERTRKQRRDALAYANIVRASRSQLKRDLAARRITIAEVIGNPPNYILTAKVTVFLAAAPGLGPVKIARLLRTARIAETKTVGGLSPRQRLELTRLLSELPPSRYVRASSNGASA